MHTVTNVVGCAAVYCCRNGWSLPGTTLLSWAIVELFHLGALTQRVHDLTNRTSPPLAPHCSIPRRLAQAMAADGVTFSIRMLLKECPASGVGWFGLSGTTPSLALAMNVYDPNTRGYSYSKTGPSGSRSGSLSSSPGSARCNATPIK